MQRPQHVLSLSPSGLWGIGDFSKKFQSLELCCLGGKVYPAGLSSPSIRFHVFNSWLQRRETEDRGQAKGGHYPLSCQSLPHFPSQPNHSLNS